MKHEKRRFVPKVDYVTSPGFGDGKKWRQNAGLPRGGPSAVITTLGILRFDPKSKEMILVSLHPGRCVEDVEAKTGWKLRISPNLLETPAPSARELEILRRFDPAGYWTGT
jgi:glutaconate CoA-transferase subunit B